MKPGQSKTIESAMSVFAYVAMSIALILAPACGDGHDSHQKNEIHSHADDRKHDESPVQLNNGKRWQADSATNESIRKMQQLASQRPGNPSVAGQELQKQFKVLLKECTMQGPAHEQLHAYLRPLQSKIKSLENCTDCQSKMEDLNSYLHTYSDYFQ